MAFKRLPGGLLQTLLVELIGSSSGAILQTLLVELIGSSSGGIFLPSSRARTTNSIPLGGFEAVLAKLQTALHHGQAAGPGKGLLKAFKRPLKGLQKAN